MPARIAQTVRHAQRVELVQQRHEMPQETGNAVGPLLICQQCQRAVRVESVDPVDVEFLILGLR